MVDFREHCRRSNKAASRGAETEKTDKEELLMVYDNFVDPTRYLSIIGKLAIALERIPQDFLRKEELAALGEANHELDSCTQTWHYSGVVRTLIERACNKGLQD